MRWRRQRQIEELADGILRETSIITIPVDLQKIATQHGIKIVPYNLTDDVSGLLVIKNGKVVIGYNDKQSNVRQRFTIAHELGHYFLAHQRGGLFVDTYKNDQKVLYRNNDSSTGEDLQEREANAFAAALLMPRKVVIEKIATLNIDPKVDDDLTSLATQFGVSTQAMTYRVMNVFD